MNEEQIKTEALALCERLLNQASGQSMTVFVSALAHAIRTCADSAPPDVRQEIGRLLLRVGGRVIAEGQALPDSPPYSFPSTSIH
ncbi:hypothetical protein ABE501_05520 [Comamonas testosteroni]